MISRVYNFLYKTDSFTQRIILIAVGVLFYIPFIGSVHLFDWDEINFAEISREMLITGEYFKSQIDFHVFYEKPPLFNWIQIGSFFLFGDNEFAARFPNALFGIFSLLLIYGIGKKIVDGRFGMLWALLYLGAFLPHFYFKTGVIDPVFNFFIFSSIYLLFCAYHKRDYSKQNKYFLLSGLLSGLSIITKGPVGILIVMLFVLVYELLYVRKLYWRRVKQFFIFGFSAFTVTLLWILPQYISSGSEFIITFTNYMLELLTQDVATHGQPFYYHFVVIFLGCFPISIIALRGLLSFQRKSKIDFNRWMFVLFWVVLLLFSIVKTKIIHYSSMTYFPLSYLAASSLVYFKKHQESKQIFMKLYLGMGIFFVIVFAALPLLLIDKTLLLDLSSNDEFSQEVIKMLDIPLKYSFIPLILLVGILTSYLFFKRRKIYKAVMIHSLIFALFLNLELAVLLPSVEYAVQGPAIEFYKRYSGKDVYLTTIGFKSYGRIYYFKKQLNQSLYSNQELLDKPLDKPVYFISKINTPQLEGRDDIEFLEKKGGFMLYVKKTQSD